MKFKSPVGTTPIDDISGLKLDWITSYEDLNIAEAENILSAMAKHFGRRKNPKSDWLTDSFLRKVHKDMFGSVWNWAGKRCMTFLTW